MRARSTLQVAGFVLLFGFVAAPTGAGTLIDMPAPPDADDSYLAEDSTTALGPVALNRYSYGRVTPLYSYRSPPA